jgi:hypothetical protein
MISFGEKAERHHCLGSVDLDDQFQHARTRGPETPFHNAGLYDIDGKGAYPPPNRGLVDITGDPDDMGKFRAPSAPNIAVTGPYMHDGSVATLEEVIDIYSRGGRKIETGPHAGDGAMGPLKCGLIVKIDPLCAGKGRSARLSEDARRRDAAHLATLLRSVESAGGDDVARPSRARPFVGGESSSSADGPGKRNAVAENSARTTRR